MVGIVEINIDRIIEDGFGFLERDTVFPEVLTGLSVILLKTHQPILHLWRWKPRLLRLERPVNQRVKPYGAWPDRSPVTQFGLPTRCCQLASSLSAVSEARRRNQSVGVAGTRSSVRFRYSDLKEAAGAAGLWDFNQGQR